MKICFFGSYKSEHARNAVVINGLRKNNVKIIEVNQESGNYWVREVKMLFKALKKDFDYIWVGFPGHQDMPFAKILSLIKKKPLIFDAFISKYDAEKEYGLIKNDNSLNAILLKIQDKISCVLADKVFFDTPQHLNFFIKKFNFSPKKFNWFYIGANETLFYPRKVNKTKKFNVLFYGYVTPQHGFEKIVEAAKILKNKKNIKFTFIGKNWRFRKQRDKYKNSLNNVEFIDGIKFDKLPIKIAEADVCLANLGDSKKGKRVIPIKLYEAIAMGKPVITIPSPAISLEFKHKENIFLCKSNAKKIANSIMELKNNKVLCYKIGQNAFSLFKKKFSEKLIGKKILNVIQSLDLK